MPVYNVNRALPSQLWNVGAAAPGAFPISQLPLANSQYVAMGQQQSVALGPIVTGLHTRHLTACSAICLLWRPAGGAWQRASLNHMGGGPDPASVNWATLAHGMVGGRMVAILANSQPTVLSAPFIAALQAAYPALPAADIWVYEANHPGGAIAFGVDWNGFAGEC